MLFEIGLSTEKTSGRLDSEALFFWCACSEDQMGSKSRDSVFGCFTNLAACVW